MTAVAFEPLVTRIHDDLYAVDADETGVCHFVLEEQEIPDLTGYPLETGWHLTLDHRFGMFVETARLSEVLWFIANSMAVAAGYSSFGRNSVAVNRFRSPVHPPEIPG